MAGEPKDFLAKRAEKIGFTAEYEFEAFPVIFWDLFGEQGHPIRATVSEMGPLLLSRLLDLNDTQEGVLNIAFKIADDEGLLLLDLKDLRRCSTYVAERASELTTRYGNVSKATVGTIQRRCWCWSSRAATSSSASRRCEIERPDAHHARRPRLDQRARRRQADAVAAALRDLPASGCCRSCSRSCPRSATRTSRSWSSSSTRRISCSTTRRRRCSRRSSRWCG